MRNQKKYIQGKLIYQLIRSVPKKLTDQLYQRHLVKLVYTSDSNLDKISAFLEHHLSSFLAWWCHFPVRPKA